MKEEKDIGILLGNRILESESQESGTFNFDAEWKTFAPKIKKLNFFQWGFTHFNLYYAFGLFLTGAIALYVSMPANEPVVTVPYKQELAAVSDSEGPMESFKLSEQGQPGDKANGTITLPPSSQDKKMPEGNDGTKNGVNIASPSTSEAELVPSVSLPLEQTPVVEEVSKRDTVQPEVKKEPAVQANVPKVKKVVVLNRQDTILKIDTVHKVKKKKIFH